jgi:hypothetical protein
MANPSDLPARSSVATLPRRSIATLEDLVEDLALKFEALDQSVTRQFAEDAKEHRVVRHLLGEILARLPEAAMREPTVALAEAVAAAPDEK